MMTLWLPIVVSAVRIIGRHPRFARLVVVRFELDRRPPTRWVELFAQVSPTSGLVAHTVEPRLMDGLVQVDARDDALDEDVASVLLHIELTNHWYSESLRGADQAMPAPSTAEDSERLEQARARAARRTRHFSRMRLTASAAWTLPTGFLPGTPSDRDF